MNIYLVTGAVLLVYLINFTRTRFPNGSFQRKGDILATPELTMASPYISTAGGGRICRVARRGQKADRQEINRDQA